MFIGLKLWSVNTGAYYEEAIRLYRKRLYDFIELYVVPGSLDTLNKWALLDMPFALHAPHFVHGVNLADSNCLTRNLVVFDEVKKFVRALNPMYTVVHGGTMGHIEETARQIAMLQLDNLLFENKPYYAPLDVNNECRGATFEEVDFVLKETGCGFCLDIGHAICSANSQGLPSYEYLAQFNQLGPQCYHLSDGQIDSEIDMHLHLGEGSYDSHRIFEIIDLQKPIVLETNKNSDCCLDDFVADVEYLNEQ